MKKYEFTGEIKTSNNGVTLQRIRAAVSFGDIEAGELGGWIEKEENVSFAGNAWVYGNARVRGNAKVCGNATVHGNAEVFGDAEVFGNARVCGNAEVFGNAKVCGNAEVYGNARVFGDAEVFGNARVCGNAGVFGNAQVSGDAEVFGNAQVSGNADISSMAHVLVIGPAGSRADFTTFYRDRDNGISVRCGCFNGKIDTFLEKVTETHGESKHAQVYRTAAGLAVLQIDLAQPCGRREDSNE